MKKLISTLSLALFACVAMAQNHVTTSLINCRSIYISNSVTFVTNLSSSASIGTNISGVTFTNLAGVRVSTNAQAANQNLLGEAGLNVDRNSLAVTSGVATNGNIFVRIGSAGAAATNAFSLVLVPLPDGINEDLTSGDAVVLTSTLAASVSGQWLFPLPVGKWSGVKSFRLQKIYTVAPAANDSQFSILGISYNRWVP